MDPGTMHVHFVGIGGAGMSGIAKILLEMGFRVSGSDLTESFRTRRLRALGAEIHIGHRKENVSFPDLVVSSSAIPSNNVELQAAKEKGIPVISRAKMLGKLMQSRVGIAVAGTHGKTTTTSMISLILEAAGLDPTVVIGGELNDIGSNAKLGEGPHFVAEADESDASFLELSPRYAVVTNIEADHLENYGSLEAIIDTFERFLALLPKDGLAVINAEDERLQALQKKLGCRQITYGLQEGDLSATDIKLKPFGSTYKAILSGELLGEVQLNVPGLHNVANSLAALGTCLSLGVSFQDGIRALREFHGVQRRFQLLGERNDIMVIDDYAHHPTEIRATLAAARQLHRRLIVVFQPHRFTRTKYLQAEFATAFADADEVIVTDIYAAHEMPILGVSCQNLADQIARHKEQGVRCLEAKQAVLDYLLENCRPGDAVLTLGAGDIRVVGESLLQLLAAQGVARSEPFHAAGGN